jgi:flagellar hook assembly protein FlgD
VDDIDLINPVYPTKLQGNYPNPFNPETIISFSLAQKSMVLIEIYNIKGQKVNTLINSFFDEGEHNITWKGIDTIGNKVGTGVYFYKMQTGDYQSVKKMVLMK